MIEETILVPGKTTARDLETRADLHGRAFCRLQSGDPENPFVLVCTATMGRRGFRHTWILEFEKISRAEAVALVATNNGTFGLAAGAKAERGAVAKYL